VTINTLAAAIGRLKDALFLQFREKIVSGLDAVKGGGGES
jgi:hypothetical protein